jgi:3-isopropylmalate/(R)-2-methylmalate dehydratase large subunit
MDPAMASRPRTLYEKIWDAHVVETRDDGTALVYIDRHLVHEVTSPQAFEALRSGRPVRRPELTLAVPITTCRPPRAWMRSRPAPADCRCRKRQPARRARSQRAGFRHPLHPRDRHPSRGLSMWSAPNRASRCPGTTIVCGDSHTACHGGLGALAFGIGTSEVEHVLATQTLLLQQSKSMEVRVEGALGPGVTRKT